MLFGKKKSFSGNFDFIVVGLGNPGIRYQNTRHNVGFMAADALAEKIGVEFKPSKFKSLIADGKIGDKRVLIMKPETFMNLSGEAVLKAMNFYKVMPEKVIVIFDDITLDIGRLRIRAKGSDGGPRGMRNIIELGAVDTFPRIKLGVGQKPHPDYDTKDWVLSKFSPKESEIILQSSKDAADAAEFIIKSDISTAMNKFNK